VNIILNLVLIPRYGINGAAFASFISYSAVTITTLSFGRVRSQAKIILRSIVFK